MSRPVPPPAEVAQTDAGLPAHRGVLRSEPDRSEQVGLRPFPLIQHPVAMSPSKKQPRLVGQQVNCPAVLLYGPAPVAGACLLPRLEGMQMPLPNRQGWRNGGHLTGILLP